ncbi:MAG: hypothetical protein IJT69_00035 [Clostridia bacterium]|nr:hypothetical protein [Clostridia bacterium]
MELTKLSVNARCDMHLCPNLAAYRIRTGKGSVSRFVGGGGLYLCPDCLRELYETVGRELVPKSPDNLIKKAIKRREENEKRN